MSPIISLIALTILAVSSGIAALGPSAVNLRTAANFAVLAKTGISTVPPSSITGAIGVSPVASTALTGFSFTLDSSGTFATSPQVVGKLFAASFTSPTPSTLTTAISDLTTAFTDATGRITPNFSNLNNGNLTGNVLTPGLYTWSGSVNIGAAGITITGLATDTWIFQIAGTLGTAAGAEIILAGGALAKNIVWVVAGSTTLLSGTHFAGILLGKTSITLDTATSFNGRILSQTFVALQTATVVEPTS